MPLDPNIDPTLQSDSLDPAALFLQGLQDDSDPPTSPTDIPDWDTAGSTYPPPNISNSATVGEIIFAPASALVEFGKLVKRHKELTERSEAEFDSFCATISPDERLALVYATLLENRDLLRASNHAVENKWTITDGLQSAIRAYTRAFILSPTISAYRGNGADTVLSVLRDLGIQDVPADKDVAQTKTVLAAIRKEFTTGRNYLKVKLKMSTEVDSPYRNVANLAQFLIGKDALNPTLTMWMRLAFLRWHIIQYPNIAEENWWIKVDETLDSWRRTLDETGLSKAFTKIYYEDQEKFGDPAETDIMATSPSSLSKWQKAVNEGAAKIHGKTIPRTKKRKFLPE